MICPHCSHNNFSGAEQCEECRQDLTQLDKPIARDRVEKSLMEDAIQTLCKRDPITTLGSTTVREAIQIMLTQDIGALLVIDEQARLIGIFSERDLLTKVAHETTPPLDHPVSEFMTSKPETGAPGHTLGFMLHQMDVGGYRHVPVVENEKPIGVISVRDMLRHLTSLCQT